MTVSRSCNKSAGVLRTCSEVGLGIARVWMQNKTSIMHYSPTSTTSHILNDESVGILDSPKFDLSNEYFHAQ